MIGGGVLNGGFFAVDLSGPAGAFPAEDQRDSHSRPVAATCKADRRPRENPTQFAALPRCALRASWSRLFKAGVDGCDPAALTRLDLGLEVID